MSVMKAMILALVLLCASCPTGQLPAETRAECMSGLRHSGLQEQGVAQQPLINGIIRMTSGATIRKGPLGL